MDALSLSHLTYCCATHTVNFHRLDHPPFPCKSRLRQTALAGKSRYFRCTSAIHLSASDSRSIWFIRKVYSMKAATIIGILLIVLGIIGYATGGISFTHEKKDVDAGPIQISHKTQDTLPLSPILSTVSLIAGVGLVVMGTRSK